MTSPGIGWVFLGALMLCAGVAALHLGSGAAGTGFALGGVPLDDAWIHLVYGRSLYLGEPFQYNSGEWETGSTSPLWALLLAPAHALPFPPVAVAKVLGVLLTAAAAAAGWRLAARLGLAAAGWIFAGALVLTPSFGFASVSCTEVPLFVFLSLAACGLLSQRRWAGAGLTTGFAILARPEGSLLLALAGAVAAVDAWRARRAADPAQRGALRGPLGFFGLALLPVVPWVGYCLCASGQPLPATFYAKAKWLGLLDGEQFRREAAVLLDQPFLGGALGPRALALAGALAGLVLVGLGLLRLARRDLRAFVLVGLFGPLYLYALSATLPLGAPVAADRPGSVRNFYFVRYLLPAVAFLLFAWSVGLAGVVAAVARRGRRAGARLAAALAVVLVAGGLPLAAAIRGQAASRALYSWNCRNIAEQQQAAAEWIAANLPPGASVAVSDAGALRYFGGRRIIDLSGLNSHRLLALNRALARAAPGSREERRVADLIWRQESPDFLVINHGWHDRMLLGRPLRRVEVFALERNTICGSSVLEVYETANAEAHGLYRR